MSPLAALPPMDETSRRNRRHRSPKIAQAGRSCHEPHQGFTWFQKPPSVLVFAPLCTLCIPMPYTWIRCGMITVPLRPRPKDSTQRFPHFVSVFAAPFVQPPPLGSPTWDWAPLPWRRAPRINGRRSVPTVGGLVFRRAAMSGEMQHLCLF